MPPARIRPPHVADERTQLVGWFGMQRAIIHWKGEGLSEADAHRPVLPASPLMTVAGVERDLSPDREHRRAMSVPAGTLSR